MGKVLGVGGIFFKSADADRLREWYKQWLKIDFHAGEGAAFALSSIPAKAFTVFSPFKEDTYYFDPSEKTFMFNLIVDQLEETLAQAKQGGAVIVGEIEVYEFGRFGWFIDPDGNKVELWEPAQ